MGWVTNLFEKQLLCWLGDQTQLETKTLYHEGEGIFKTKLYDEEILGVVSFFRSAEKRIVIKELQPVFCQPELNRGRTPSTPPHR